MKVQIDSKAKLEKIDRANFWLAGLGLPVSNNRYVKARNVLAKGIEAGEVDQGQMVEFQWALQELDDFLVVHEFLEDEAPSVIGVLEKALKGAPHALGETASSARARNFLFELVAATHFVRQGLLVRFEGEADFIVEVNGSDVFVECKRGVDMPGLLEKAFKQIEKRCLERGNASVAGIAAVCITPMVMQDMDQNGPVIAPRELIEKTMRDTASKFNFSDFRKHCPPGLGVLTHFAFPFWEVGDLSLTLLRRNDFYPLRNLQEPLIRSLQERLSAGTRPAGENL